MNKNTFGSAKINKIEYFSNKKQKWKRSNIKDLRILAVAGTTPSDGEPYRWNRGHNLCVVFGQDQKKVYEDIISVIKINSQYTPFLIYLMGKNGIKIPTLCSEANDWVKLGKYDEETACIFTYLPPMTFDNEWDKCEYNHPKIKTK